MSSFSSILRLITLHFHLLVVMPISTMPSSEFTTPSTSSSHSFSFTFINTCPHEEIYLKYSTTVPSMTPIPASPSASAPKKDDIQLRTNKLYQTNPLKTGMSSLQVIPTSSLYYEIYSKNHTLLTSSQLKFPLQHFNAIGYIFNQSTSSCQPFQYLISDLNLMKKSLLIILNPNHHHQNIYVDHHDHLHPYQAGLPSPLTSTTVTEGASAGGGGAGTLTSHPFLQIIHEGDISYSSNKLQIKFCSKENITSTTSSSPFPATSSTPSPSCTVWDLRSSLFIPSGSALFIYHYHTTHEAHHKHDISIAPTGETSLYCDEECENDLNDDLIENFFWDGLDPITVMSYLYHSMIIGCFLLSGCIGYLFYSFQLSFVKKNEESDENDKKILEIIETKEILETPLPPSNDIMGNDIEMKKD